MRVTNEQLEDILKGENYGIECDEVNDTSIHAISSDLLEAREIIKEMREALSIHATRDINCQCEFCEKQRAILEKSKDYA